MKITFTEQHQSVASGNEFYRRGQQADLPRGDELVKQGVAIAGWAKLAYDRSAKDEEPAQSKATEQPQDAQETPQTPLEDYTVAELQEMARERDVTYSGLRKAELIEALRGD